MLCYGNVTVHQHINLFTDIDISLVFLSHLCSPASKAAAPARTDSGSSLNKRSLATTTMIAAARAMCAYSSSLARARPRCSQPATRHTCVWPGKWRDGTSNSLSNKRKVLHDRSIILTSNLWFLVGRQLPFSEKTLHSILISSCNRKWSVLR